MHASSEAPSRRRRACCGNSLLRTLLRTGGGQVRRQLGIRQVRTPCWKRKAAREGKFRLCLLACLLLLHLRPELAQYLEHLGLAELSHVTCGEES